MTSRAGAPRPPRGEAGAVTAFAVAQLIPQLLLLQRRRDTLGVVVRSGAYGGGRGEHGRKGTPQRSSRITTRLLVSRTGEKACGLEELDVAHVVRAVGLVRIRLERARAARERVLDRRREQLSRDALPLRVPVDGEADE